MLSNFLRINIWLALCVLLVSCADEKKQNFFVKDGLIHSASDGKLFSGTIKDKVVDKTIQYDVVNGTKTGKFAIYYSNGNPETLGQMKNNLNEGKWSYYYPNGQVESEGLFKNDIAEGKWVWYFEDGKLKEEGVFKSGKREGNWVMYNSDGNIIEQANFVNGEKVLATKDS